jgi:CHAT domain-containing protein/tetratricopeptide (TPR) repeat protein
MQKMLIIWIISSITLLSILFQSNHSKLLADSKSDELKTISSKAYDAFMNDDSELALCLFQQALDLSRVVLGPEDPFTIATHEYLSLTHVMKGDNQKASEMMCQVVYARLKVFGPNHPETLRAFSNLAHIYENINNLGKALEFYQKLYDGSKVHFGLYSHETILAMESLAEIFLNIGNVQESAEVYKQLFDIKSSLLGSLHDDTIATLDKLIRIYNEHSEHELALKFAQQAYALRISKYGHAHQNTINYRENMANMYVKLGNRRKAIECFQEVYESRQILYGKHDFMVLGAIGVNYSYLGEHQKALEYKQRAWEGLVGSSFISQNDPPALYMLDELSKTYKDIGDKKNALKSKKKVWQGLVIYAGPYNRISLWCLENLADLYMNYEDYSEATELYQQLYEIRTAKFGSEEEDFDTLISIYKLSNALTHVGEEQKALLLRQKFNEISRQKVNLENEDALNQIEDEFREKYYIMNVFYFIKEDSGEFPDDLENVKKKYNICVKNHESINAIPCLRVLSKVALLTKDEIGDIRKAAELQQQVFESMKNVIGGTHEETLTALHNLAIYMQDIGEYQKSFELNQQAFENRKIVLGLENENTLFSLCNLASSYASLGEYKVAFKLYKDAFEGLKKKLGPKDIKVLNILGELSLIYLKSGDLPNALYYQQQAWKGLNTILGAGHPETIHALGNLATVYEEIGDHLKSLELNEQILEMTIDYWGPEHAEVFTAQYKLAQTYASLKNYDKAYSILKKTIAEFTQEFGLYNPQTLAVAMSLAELSNNVGQFEKAIFYAKFVVSALQSQRQEIDKLDKELRESYLAKIEKSYLLLASWLLKVNRPEESLYVLCLLKEDAVTIIANELAHKAENYIELNSDELMSNLVRLGEILTQAGQNNREMFREYRQKEYDDKTDELDDKIKIKIEEQLDKANRDFQAFLDQLPSYLDEFSQKNIFVESSRKNQVIRQKLLEDFGSGTVIINTFNDNDTLHIFLTTASGLTIRNSPVGSMEMEAKVATLQSLLRSPELDPRSVANDIYKAVITPLVDDLIAANAKTLLFSVDGALRYIPMATLYDGQKWLIEDYAVVMFSEATKAYLSNDAIYNVKVAALGLSESKDGLDALPSVEEELNHIVKSKGEKTGILPGSKFLNEKFNYNSLSSSLLEGNQILHLASHFVFRPIEPSQSYLLLGDGSKLILSDLRYDDKLPFRKLDLLTLSACDTASGLAKGNGREVEGLANLALIRGASTVLATLWPIADESTGHFMSSFYTFRYLKKNSKAESLRQSQLNFIQGRTIMTDGQTETRGKIKIHSISSLVDNNLVSKSQHWTGDTYAHPYFWAPFILMGNWK